MARIIDGNAVAARIREEVKAGLAGLKADFGVTPGLTVVIVGEDPASKVYVSRKHKACEELGIKSAVIRLPADIDEEALGAAVDSLNDDPAVHGILVQLPLPKHIDAEKVLDRIRPDKDVDGFHPLNVGRLAIGREALVPCTPHGVIRMLELEGIQIAGKRAVVIGRSNIVGKPMANLLLARNATVTVCHSRTPDLPAVTRQAEILVAAIGKPGFVTADMVAPGAVVIDVGINRVGDKLVGDVDFERVKEVAAAITPVPGGVGPLTIAMLLHNTVKAARLQLTK
ncbi:bifunctional methylenetetrahydrofolate dehydrogenase/methenyltetrahydrofolate cyclohydrolase FolD [Anaeroselena agilis]|uniref:Bifunctional protein FolD n=1 Tax=Anaeroselena agilis TaxID=3063788 RepID=A0ABU3P3M6_9FIRM|nr:bifunctional methylenetetrahydrofolate dehydrogenase/methenyltetrahydrofolate cyclohydrolase FolD [Selenomonadales bacterium 4137-cl]